MANFEEVNKKLLLYKFNKYFHVSLLIEGIHQLPEVLVTKVKIIKRVLLNVIDILHLQLVYNFGKLIHIIADRINLL